jgi:catechol 2,3-dioxygenase-like lactoylglutathione lyase family enzyme
VGSGTAVRIDATRSLFVVRSTRLGGGVRRPCRGFLAVEPPSRGVDATAIDHVNLRIPADGMDAALAFYRDSLGFEADRLDAFEAGEKPFFSVRLTPGSVLHLWPDPSFEPPTGTNFDHVAVRLDESLADLRTRLDRAGIDVERSGDPLGATGTGPAVYVEDPFGYRIELKADRD